MLRGLGFLDSRFEFILDGVCGSCILVLRFAAQVGTGAYNWISSLLHDFYFFDDHVVVQRHDCTCC